MYKKNNDILSDATATQWLGPWLRPLIRYSLFDCVWGRQFSCTPDDFHAQQQWRHYGGGGEPPRV